MAETVAVRAIIVDSRPLFCDAIRTCLTKGGCVVLSQARDFDEAIRQAHSLHPDLMIVGTDLAQSSLAECRGIVAHLPTLKVILFTAHADEALFQADAVHAGVAACLRPESSGEECLTAIAQAMAGHQLFPKEILSLAFQPIKLTRRELTVLSHMAAGKTDREIADALNLKFSTVRNHSQHILEKLNVHSRQEAVCRARHRGLV